MNKELTFYKNSQAVLNFFRRLNASFILTEKLFFFSKYLPFPVATGVFTFGVKCEGPLSNIVPLACRAEFIHLHTLLEYTLTTAAIFD